MRGTRSRWRGPRRRRAVGLGKTWWSLHGWVVGVAGGTGNGTSRPSLATAPGHTAAFEQAHAGVECDAGDADQEDAEDDDVAAQVALRVADHAPDAGGAVDGLGGDE